MRRLRWAAVMRDWARWIWRLRVSFLRRWASSSSFFRSSSSWCRASWSFSSWLSSSCGFIASLQIMVASSGRGINFSHFLVS